MATHNPNHALLRSTIQIPIAQLSPSLESTVSRSIEAIVTLIWPYSSASNSIIFLFSEPDFRLRNSRGQVRVEFSGPSGKSIVKAGVSSGDRVILSLDGVEWIQDVSNTSIPGRGIEFKLRYTKKIFLKFQRKGSEDLQEIHVDNPLAEDLSLYSKNALASEPECLLDSSDNLDQTVPGKLSYESHLYSSPAFLKRARTSYGSLFDSALDTFIEADGSIQGKGRKKSRLSLTWGYRSPSPDLEEDESKEDISIEIEENNFKQVKSNMIDEGIQTNEDSSIEMSEQSKSVPVTKGGSLSIPITTYNLTREKLTIKEHHFLITDENKITNNQPSDLMSTEDTNVKLLISPQKSSLPSEIHIQESLIEQSSISGNFGKVDTQPIVRGSEFSPTICIDEVKNHLNDSDSNESVQVENGIQNPSTNVKLSRQETCRSSPKFEEEDAPDNVSLTPSSDRNIEPQPNSSLSGNLTSKSCYGEKSTVENFDNESIRLIVASPDQDLTKVADLPVQDLKISKMTNGDQVQSSSTVKCDSEHQPNFAAVPPSPPRATVSTSDSRCRVGVSNPIKEDNNRILVETNRPSIRYKIPPVGDDETETLSRGISEGHMISSSHQGSENENYEEQSDAYQVLTDSESDGYDENYHSQYDEEMISDQDGRFSNMSEDSKEDYEEDSMSESEKYHHIKEVPMYIDLVSSDDDDESSISTKVHVQTELESFQAELTIKDFDENDEEEKENRKEAEITQVEEEEEEDKSKLEIAKEWEMEQKGETEEIKSVKEAGVVEEIEDIEEVEELGEMREAGETKEVEKIEETVKIQEIQEVEAMDEAQYIEEVEKTVEIKEITELEDVEGDQEMRKAEEIEEMEESDKVEEADEIVEIKEAEVVEGAQEMTELEGSEESVEMKEVVDGDQEMKEVEESDVGEEAETTEESVEIQEVKGMESAQEMTEVEGSEESVEINEINGAVDGDQEMKKGEEPEEAEEAEEPVEIQKVEDVEEMEKEKDGQKADKMSGEKDLIPPYRFLETIGRPHKYDLRRIISVEKRHNSVETDAQQVDISNTNFSHKEISSKITLEPQVDRSNDSNTEEEITNEKLSVIRDISRTVASQVIASEENPPIYNSTTNFMEKGSYPSRSLSERNSQGTFIEKILPRAENVTNDSKRMLRSMKSHTSSKVQEPNSSFRSGVKNLRSRGLGHDASFEIALSSLDSPSKRRSPPIVDSRIRFSRTLRTELSEYTPLKLLRQHLNEKIDVLAVVTSTPIPPKRVKGGPRDYLLTFNIIDPSIAPISVTGIQIFRPYQDALPVVEIGDGIILRNFQVVMDKNIYSLKSKMEEGSSWAVVKSTGEIQIRGPPVEHNMKEIDYVSDLQAWFSELDIITRSKFMKANGKVGENKK